MSTSLCPYIGRQGSTGGLCTARGTDAALRYPNQFSGSFGYSPGYASSHCDDVATRTPGPYARAILWRSQQVQDFSQCVPVVFRPPTMDILSKGYQGQVHRCSPSRGTSVLGPYNYWRKMTHKSKECHLSLMQWHSCTRTLSRPSQPRQRFTYLSRAVKQQRTTSQISDV